MSVQHIQIFREDKIQMPKDKILCLHGGLLPSSSLAAQPDHVVDTSVGLPIQLPNHLGFLQKRMLAFQTLQ